MEVIDAIEGLKLCFNGGNCLKYIARHQYKGNPLEDLRKAEWYLQRLIRNEELRIRKAKSENVRSENTGGFNQS